MRISPHAHPCQHCLVSTECCGDVEQNYDGWPEWICVAFDTHNHGDFLCEDCAALFEAGVCEDCGAWGTEAHDAACALVRAAS